MPYGAVILLSEEGWKPVLTWGRFGDGAQSELREPLFLPSVFTQAQLLLEAAAFLRNCPDEVACEASQHIHSMGACPCLASRPEVGQEGLTFFFLGRSLELS